MDSLFEQVAQITKSHAYDIVVKQVVELKAQNIELMGHNKELMNESETNMDLNVALSLIVKELKHENELLKIKLKGAEMRILALQEFINNVRPEGVVPMEFPTI